MVSETDQPVENMRYFAHVENDVVDYIATYAHCECVDKCEQQCEQEAENALQEVANGVWVQTWISGGPRKHYAHIGGTYDSKRDAFIPPQTHPSWILNDESLVWEPPVPHPTNFTTSGWEWNEETLQWDELIFPN